MQCLKRSKSKPDKGLVIAIAPLVRNAGLAILPHLPTELGITS